METSPPNTKTPPPAPCEALTRPQSLKAWASGLAAIVSRNTDEIFQDYEFRENNLTRADLGRCLGKIRNCASTMELRARVDRETGEIGSPGIHAANYCGQIHLCPQCASRVSDRRRARFRVAIMDAAKTYRHAYLVTATISPSPSWRDNLTGLMRGWGAFRKMGQKRGGRKKERDPGEFGKIKAGISKIEIKRGSGSGLPHCHIHAILFTSEPFDFRVWSETEKMKPREDRRSLFPNCMSKISNEWSQATSGMATGIDVKLIRWKKPKRKKDESVNDYRDRCNNWSVSDSVFEQSREVLKYATKFDTSPSSQDEKIFARDIIGIKSATFRKRCFQTFGAFRGIGGSDFVGDENPRTENPILYETRWDTDRFSPLKEIKSPLFPEMEPGPYRAANLTALNRIQGATQRMRRSVSDAKAGFLASGYLSPAIFGIREYQDGGGYHEKLVALEIPSAIIADPHDLQVWEDWTDALTCDGRNRYSAMRDYLRCESHVRLTGSPAELAAEAAFARSVYLASEQYQLDVVRSFLEVLAPQPDTP